MHGAREVALLPLVLLADVEQERAIRLVESFANLRRGDLGDLLLDLCQQLSVGSHYFPEYSDAGMVRNVTAPVRSACGTLVFPATVRP